MTSLIYIYICIHQISILDMIHVHARLPILTHGLPESRTAFVQKTFVSIFMALETSIVDIYIYILLNLSIE
jgi:hypothetical protein